MVLKLAEKDAGRAAAESLIKAAAIQNDLLLQAEEAYANGAYEAQELLKSASADVQQSIVKLAKAHSEALNQFEYDFEKIAYEKGAMAAAQMADAGLMEDQMPADYDPEQVQGGDIVAVLDQLVQSGQITPEQAAQIVEMISGGDPDAGGAPAPEAAPAGGEGAAPAAPAAPAEGGDKEPKKEETEKEASAAKEPTNAFEAIDQLMVA
jgi:hypothetical protein